MATTSQVPHMAPPAKGMPLQAKVEAAANLLNPLLDAYMDPDLPVGQIKTFVEDLKNHLLSCGLMYEKSYPVEVIGTHSCNREGQGVLPIDVQDL